MEMERMKVEMEIGKRKRRIIIVCNKLLMVKYRVYSLFWLMYRRIMVFSLYKINSVYVVNVWKIIIVIIINYVKIMSFVNCVVMRIGKCVKMNFVNSVFFVNYVDCVIMNNLNVLRKFRKMKSLFKNSICMFFIIWVLIVCDENIVYYFY